MCVFKVWTNIIRTLRLGGEDGQTLVEYALILSVISIVALGVMINMRTQLTGVYSMINSQVASAAASH